MICRSQNVFYCLALLVIASAPVKAAQDSAEGKTDSRKTKVVKQADGSEVIRLADMTYGPSISITSNAISTHGQLPGEWPDEPRLMTALGTLPGMPRGEGQSLTEAVDPSLVRSWAEFIDPSLALKWKSYAQINGFSEVQRWRADEGTKGPHVASQTSPVSGKAPWVNTAVGTTWRNVVSEGAKRALPGQQALHEWLMLPMPEPKSNPWLSNLGSYRY